MSRENCCYFLQNKCKGMKNVLCIDPGLLNLGMCCIKNDEIVLWDVYDVMEIVEHVCTGLQKNGKICGKKCGFTDGKDYFSCKKHFKNESAPKKVKKKKVKDHSFQDIAKNILIKLQEIYEKNHDVFRDLKKVIIELQPKINPRITFVSHIIYGKMVELFIGTDTQVRFVRASRKLHAYTGPAIECKLKGAYAKRKWLSIQYCKWIIQNKFSAKQSEVWLPFFETKKIQADMSDAFLMAING